MVSRSQDQVLDSPGAVTVPSGRRWASLFVVCIGVMMAFVNASSTLAALPHIQDDLHVSGSTLVWIPSAFTLAVVSLVMSGGTFGELYGRRLTHLLGLLLIVVGSSLSLVADGAGLLIAGQAVIGVGAAAVLPSGLAIVATTFTDPRERTGAISIWASTAGLGLAVGPLAAGVLLDHVSWNSVYATDVALGLVGIVLTLALVTEGKAPGRRLDPAGIVLGTLAVAAATYAIIEGGARGYAAGLIIVAYVVAALALVLFVVVELRHPDPMLDLRLFRNASFTTTMLVGASVMFGFVGIALLSVLYLERVAGLSALETGVRLLPMMGSYIVVSALAVRVVRRIGFRSTLVSGLVLVGVGSLALLPMDPEFRYSSMWPGLLLVGVGSALLVAPSTAVAVNAVRPEQAGMASAAINMFRQLGSMLGPSVLGTIATTQFPARLADRLEQGGVPAGSASDAAASLAQGAAPELSASLVGPASAVALTGALDVAWLVAGLVLLLIAVPAGLFIRPSAH